MFFIKLRMFPFCWEFLIMRCWTVNAFLHLLICSCSFSLDVDVVGYVNCFSDKLFIWLCWFLNVTLRISHSSLWTLSCGMWDLVPWPGIEPGLPALGVWSLSLWATREAPLAVFRHECRLPSYIVAQCNRMQLCSTGENHRNPTEIKLSVQIFHFTFHVRNDSALVSLQHHLQLWKLREEEQERNSISCHWKA